MVETRCGYVATVGRPNAGKSSLLNWLIGEKIAMVSHKANATRKRSNIIAMHQGIDEKEESQIILYPLLLGHVYVISLIIFYLYQLLLITEFYNLLLP